MNRITQFLDRHLRTPYKSRYQFSSMLEFQFWHIEERARVAQNNLILGIGLGLLLGGFFMLLCYLQGKS